MFIPGKVTECDFTQTTYDTPVDGVHCLARGATGRVCCVMYAGPEYAAEHNWEIATREQAEAWAKDHPGGSVDF